MGKSQSRPALRVVYNVILLAIPAEHQKKISLGLLVSTLQGAVQVLAKTNLTFPQSVWSDRRRTKFACNS